MGGGGGTTGEVSFPDHIMKFHNTLLVGFENLSTSVPAQDVALIDLVESALDGGNPYTSFTYTSPDFTDSDSAISDLGTALAAYTPTNAISAIQAIITQVLLDASSLNTAVTEADVTIDDVPTLSALPDQTAVTYEPTDPTAPEVDVPTADVDDVGDLDIGSHSITAITPGVLTFSNESERNVDVSLGSDPTISPTVGNDVLEFLENFTSGLDENVDFETIATGVLQIMEDNDLSSSINAEKDIIRATSDAGKLVKAAIEIAKESLEEVGEVDLEELIAPYVARIEAQKAVALKNNAAGYADINAIHSTAFIFSGAQIEAEAIRQIGAYRQEAEFYKLKINADLQNILYQSGLSNYTNLLSTTLQGRLGASESDARSRDTIYRDAIRLVSGLLTNRTSFERGFAQLYTQAI